VTPPKLLALAFLLLAACASTHNDSGLSLSTIPTRVYKTDDGAGTESWVFSILVNANDDRAVDPTNATLDLFSGDRAVKTIVLSAEALKAVRDVRFKGTGFTARAFAAQNEAYDLRHPFTEPVALKIDRVRYKLRFAGGVEKQLDIPILTYAPKAKLVFPLKGYFMVINGWVTDRGHSEWSQHFAYDITGLGTPRLDLIKSNGETNDDYLGWGREVLAPAGGVVLYARNDVGDNPKPGTVDPDALAKLPDAMWAVGGNCVVIDHGNGEFSFLAHMQHGSVRVKKGDRLEQGAVIGLLGNSGNSQAPHLHYHLMAGPAIFRSDPLPSRFENADVPVPKRGQYMEAK
jgi:murein DD-endopeptidase MepM/ murein hydrolase activator NlpD